MANTLNISASLNASVAGQQYLASAQAIVVPAGSGAIKQNQSIATSATAVALGGIADPAYVVIQNLDAANYISVSFENTAAVTPQTVIAGGFVILSPGSNPVYAKANTSAVEITVTAITV